MSVEQPSAKRLLTELGRIWGDPHAIFWAHTWRTARTRVHVRLLVHPRRPRWKREADPEGTWWFLWVGPIFVKVGRRTA